jgi:hypothetical protein
MPAAQCRESPWEELVTAAAGVTRSRRDDRERIRMIVSGEHGAVEYQARAADGAPLGIDCHSAVPRYEDARPVSGCDLIDGPCYAFGTGTGAADLHRDYLRRGQDEEVIWRDLEIRYALLAAG